MARRFAAEARGRRRVRRRPRRRRAVADEIADSRAGRRRAATPTPEALVAAARRVRARSTCSAPTRARRFGPASPRRPTTSSSGRGRSTSCSTSTPRRSCCPRCCARRRLPADHGVGRRSARHARRRAVLGHQARGRRPRRVAGDHLRRARGPGLALCPLGVRTALLDASRWPTRSARRRCSPPAARTRGRRRRGRAGLGEEEFLILPHEIVGKYVALKGADHERWLTGMRRLVRAAREAQ